MGGQHLGQAARALRLAGTDDRAFDRDQRHLGLQAGLPERLSGRHGSPGTHLPRHRHCRDHPAMAAEGPLRRVAHRELEGRRPAVDLCGGSHHRRIPRFHALPVVVQP